LARLVTVLACVLLDSVVRIVKSLISVLSEQMELPASMESSKEQLATANACAILATAVTAVRLQTHAHQIKCNVRMAEQ